MRFAICYSGQIRHTRVVLMTHINNIFKKIYIPENIVDVYFYTNSYNSSKYLKKNHGICNFYDRGWTIDNLGIDIIDDIINIIKKYSNNVKTFIDTTIDNCKIDDYAYNLQCQLDKFLSVLKMVDGDYDYVIRIRPDVLILDDILKYIPKDNTIIQTIEENDDNYKGDSIQIFKYEYLKNIISQIEKYKVTNIKYLNKSRYEYVINDIFAASGLKLSWMKPLSARWFNNYTIYIDGVRPQYFNDWVGSSFYKCIFNPEFLLKIINNNINCVNTLVLLDDDKYLFNKYEIKETNIESLKIYIMGFLPDIIKINTTTPNIEIVKFIEDHQKDIIGLLPCSGSATRIYGIPKFLLPCKNNVLLDNSIKLFKDNYIENVYACVSKQNEPYIKQRYKDTKYIVKDTNTMSETVKNLLEFNSKKYILIMPDTYFTINDEIKKMIDKLNIYDIVVLLWKIREDQYGKLGQVNIDTSNEIVTDIKDKDIYCKYQYSWGVIGWTKKMNNFIDSSTPHIGYLLNYAIKNDIKIGYVIVNSEYYDCGTPYEYFKMIKNIDQI